MNIFKYLGVFLMALGVVFILIFSLVYGNYSSANENIKVREIEAEGIKGEAVIMSILEKKDYSFNDLHPIVLKYRFFMKNRFIIDDVEVLGDSEVKKLQVNDKIEIMFNDNGSYPIGLELFYPTFLLYGIAIFVFVLISGFFIYVGSRRSALNTTNHNFK